MAEFIRRLAQHSRRIVIFAAFASSLVYAAPAFAVSIVNVGSGGTGIGFPGGFAANTLLTGNGLNPIATTTIGTGLTLAGGVLSASAGAFTFPWTPVSYGNATSTTLGFLNGFLATASSTINANVQFGTGFFWDNTNVRLGVGTTTPGSLFSIGGSGTGVNFFDNGTTTFSGKGINLLNGGCFAIAGTCIGANSGTVTSVALSGGTTGLTTSGGPITSSGTITLAGILAIANGGTGTTTAPVSQLLYGGSGGIYQSVATSSIGVSAGLTNTGALGSQIGGSALTLKQVENRSFTYATSSAWTGTTTIPLEVGYGEVWNTLKCFTDTGTLNVQFGYGTASTTLFNASTTIGTVAATPNNTMTAGNKVAVDIGTPASTPTKITCSVNDTI